MNKKYAKKHAEENKRLKEVQEEFGKLEKAMSKYKEAMMSRLQSAQFNGKVVNNHYIDVANSHQSEIDKLRDAAMKFSEKVCGYDYRTAIEKAAKIFAESMEESENNALL